MIEIVSYNEVYSKVNASKEILLQLSEHFTLDVPGARFMPAFRFGWDGKIRLLNLNNGLIYKGLINSIKKFGIEDGLDVVDHVSSSSLISSSEAQEFFQSLNLPFSVRDYQELAFVEAIRQSRLLMLCPTASGKSLIMYLLTRYYKLKTLIIVPTTALVNQLSDDFSSYGYTEEIHKIFSGKEKQSDNDICISTWQSIYKMPPEWFSQYDLVIVDEAHTAKAASLKTIMENMTKCKYRFALTGTLDGTKTNEMVLVGLFRACI